MPIARELMSYEQSQHRCRGLMVGLGVGNVLGIPQEGWPRHMVEASYPNGIRDIEGEPGEPDDDDLAQAIILAEAAIDAGSGEIDVEEIGRRFWVWAEENGRGIGIQTADVLSRIGGDMPRCARGAGVQARGPSGVPALEAARQVWEKSGHYSAGNGAVMRCAPLAIRWKRDDDALARNTALSAVVTHADPRCRSHSGARTRPPTSRRRWSPSSARAEIPTRTERLRVPC